jgi:putative ABC transport system ATP-binding protein
MGHGSNTTVQRHERTTAVIARTEAAEGETNAAVLESVAATKVYGSDSGEVRAVDGASFAVRPGEFVALVGPSGSGKTTMLALLAGLLSPTDGTVRIGGNDLYAMSEGERARFRRESIGFTFQANNLVPYLTVRENVELALRLSGRLDAAGRARAVDLLARLGLRNRLDSLPSQLSGGQQQRVAIARSLVHDPLVVLADEPTASLDTERAFQVVAAFRDLVKERGRAGVMVTHDLRMTRYTDAVVRMVDGRVADIIRGERRILAFAGLSPDSDPQGRALGEREVLLRNAFEIAG